MPWRQNDFNDINILYPQVKYKNSYVAIQEFLRNEGEVNSALTSFQTIVEGSGITTPAAFNNFINQVEVQLGFSPNVVTVQDLLTPIQFLVYVNAGRPLQDVGAGPEHGFVTHRVQWILIASKFDDSLEATVLELYTNLSCANAYSRNQAEGYQGQGAYLPGMDQEDRGIIRNVAQNESAYYRFLWDDLLDRVLKPGDMTMNGTCPEYLHNYIDVRPNFRLLSRVWS